ncbi:hypothetical protein Tco_0685872 [Tanacetum coccineum]
MDVDVEPWDPYFTVDSFRSLTNPHAYYKMKKVRVDFVWLDENNNKLYYFLHDKDVPPNLVAAYKDKTFAQTFVSIHNFQVVYSDPTGYPRYQTYSFLRRDWFIAVNSDTVITENLFAEETGFQMHSWLPSIRCLVGDKTQRKMMIDTVGRVIRGGLQKPAGYNTCEIWLRDMTGAEIKFVAFHTLRKCIKMETIGLKAAASISSDSVSSFLGKESIATLRHSSSKCRQLVSNILKCPPVKFDAFGFSVKDFMTRRVLHRCDSTGDLYPVTQSSTILHVFLTSQYTWHQRLGHPEKRPNNLISYIIRTTPTNNTPLHIGDTGSHHGPAYIHTETSQHTPTHSTTNETPLAQQHLTPIDMPSHSTTTETPLAQQHLTPTGPVLSSAKSKTHNPEQPISPPIDNPNPVLVHLNVNIA